MVQLPPQGLDAAVPAVHFAEQHPHGRKGLGLAPIPWDFLPVPSLDVEYAGGAFTPGPLQDLSPQNGNLPRRFDHQLAAVSGNAVQLDHYVFTDGHVFARGQV